ncbi:hypothetical protein ABK040_008616 [Willaertia magna]
MSEQQQVKSPRRKLTPLKKKRTSLSSSEQVVVEPMVEEKVETVQQSITDKKDLNKSTSEKKTLDNNETNKKNNKKKEINLMGEVEDVDLDKEKNEFDFPEEDFLKEIEKKFFSREKEMKEEENENEIKNKVKITKEIVPKTDNELFLNKEESEKYEQVRASFRVNIIRRLLKITLQLHKIPEKFINIDVEDDHLTIDTLKYTKKLYLKRKYPGLIQVKKETATAKGLKNGIIILELELKSIPEETFNYHLQMIQQKQEAKKLRFQPEVSQKIIKNADLMEKKRKRREKQKEKKNYMENHMYLKKKKK